MHKNKIISLTALTMTALYFGACSQDYSFQAKKRNALEQSFNETSQSNSAPDDGIYIDDEVPPMDDDDGDLVGGDNSGGNDGGGNNGGGSSGGNGSEGSGGNSGGGTGNDNGSSSGGNGSSGGNCSSKGKKKNDRTIRFNRCEDVTADRRITVDDVLRGRALIPETSIYRVGHGPKSIHWCTCKYDNETGRYTVNPASAEGKINGVGHRNSFFIRKENCPNYKPNQFGN